MANSNQRDLRAWQATFGPVHLIAALGLVTGCLAVAFYLGFFSGQKIGIETALQNNLATAMRLPIGSEGEENALEDGLSDVYAKLGDAELGREESGIKVVKGKEPSNGKIAAERSSSSVLDKVVPELAPIQVASRAGAGASTRTKGQADVTRGKDADESKVIQGVIYSAPADKIMVAQGTESSPSWREGVDSNTGVRVLGGGSGVPPAENAVKSGKTLGSLSEEAEHRAVVKIESQAAAQVQSAPEEIAGRLTKHSTDAKLPASASASAADQESQARMARPLEGKSATVKAAGKIVPRGWFAQIVAPRSHEEAETMASKLRQSGFAVVIENARVRGEEYFRVLVGPEESRQQAERLLAQLKREPYVKGEPFIRMVR